jgi:hypothetical protein
MLSMPRPKRPKRQRPPWLPRWMPFKDGRYLGLAKQTILAWSSTILALIFFSMTVSFAVGTSRLWQIKAVNSSQSNSILILRVFSEAAGLFLAGTVHSTFAVIQWVLVSRPEGIRFPQFLALQPSTGPLGLLVLASGKGLTVEQWPFKPRLLSLLRLIAEVAVPLMGVLIMSTCIYFNVFVTNGASLNENHSVMIGLSFGEKFERMTWTSLRMRKLGYAVLLRTLVRLCQNSCF